MGLASLEHLDFQLLLSEFLEKKKEMGQPLDSRGGCYGFLIIVPLLMSWNHPCNLPTETTVRTNVLLLDFIQITF